MRRRPLIIALLLITFIVAIGLGEENTYQQEGDRLASELNWHEGSVVADIGAGRGELTLIAAKRVGASGQVYATELEPKKLALLEALAAKNKNITALKAGESRTNLPTDCCESIFMRLVYHHFSKPAESDASLFRSLKPGGLLGASIGNRLPGASGLRACPRTVSGTACRKGSSSRNLPRQVFRSQG